MDSRCAETLDVLCFVFHIFHRIHPRALSSLELRFASIWQQKNNRALKYSTWIVCLALNLFIAIHTYRCTVHHLPHMDTANVR